MNPETAAALEDSIEHWEENVAAETPDKAHTRGSSCALCEMFAVRRFARKKGPPCVGCPVMQKTGLPGCRDTPWSAAHSSLLLWGAGISCGYEKEVIFRFQEEWRTSAQAMVDFLKGLREPA